MAKKEEKKATCSQDGIRSKTPKTAISRDENDRFLKGVLGNPGSQPASQWRENSTLLLLGLGEVMVRKRR